MKYSDVLKSKLNDIIVDVSMSSEFVRNPKTDFTRSRKLGFLTTFNSILTMGVNTLDSELLDLFEYDGSTPCKSAFVQARNKILPEAFSHTFYEFTSHLPRYKTHKGFHLLSVDGSSLNLYRNPHDKDTFNNQGNHRGYNEMELVAMYDLLNNVYTDAVLQDFNHKDERGALIDMIPNISDRSIVICDRGYESYNVFAHFEEANQKYIVRVKDIDSNGILSGLKLPGGEFDKVFTVNIS
ncbi:MAG: transposase, partial [Candidatus Izimaplasma sp.]|nr:transposase [Candidatus Izimaplasma bacterium]